MISRVREGAIDKIVNSKGTRLYWGSEREFLADIAVADKERIDTNGSDRATIEGGDYDVVVRIGKISKISGAVEAGVFDYPMFRIVG
jgi:hypothetical protein